MTLGGVCAAAQAATKTTATAITTLRALNRFNFPGAGLFVEILLMRNRFRSDQLEPRVPIGESRVEILRHRSDVAHILPVAAFCRRPVTEEALPDARF